MKLQTQARIGTLFELANLAFERKDYAKASQITREILNLGPYQPAESLERRIEQAQRKPESALAPPPIAARSTNQAPVPSDGDKSKADEYFQQALRLYTDGRLTEALSFLREAKRLNKESAIVNNFMDGVDRELKQQAKP